MSRLFIDLDGTLLDVSEKYYRIYLSGITDASTRLSKFQFWEMKRSEMKDEEIYGVTGHILTDDTTALKAELLEKDEYLGMDKVHDGVLPFLNEIKDKHELVLVTVRKDSEALNRQLDRSGLCDFFTAILCTGPLAAGQKGYEKKIKLIQDRFPGLDVKATYIIGDTEADIKCGRQLGIKTVGVLSGLRNYAAMKKLAPDLIIPFIYDIKPILDE